LLEGIALHYGYDFRDYALAPLRRNILMSMAFEGVATISAYQDRVLHNPASLQRFLNAVSVSVTSMFREAIALRVLREEIVPWLRTYPSVRIWVAGCATGEEVASLAIVLRETGMLGRTRIYATDINETSLAIAARGLLPLESVQSSEADYLRSGGSGALTDYYSVAGDMARLDRTLFSGVTWARHNLVTDASFNEFHVILCTNVLTHFSRQLQVQVRQLLNDSLVRSGYLIVGRLESVIGWGGANVYNRVDESSGVYRKIAS
jgi:chemotaxis protein methyltransferase CheR